MQAATTSPVYTVNAVKSFIGMEGHGFNANLLRDGIKVAFVRDDASGGPYSFDWLDYKAPRVEGVSRNYKDEDVKRSMTPEEAKWEAFIYALPENPKVEGEDFYMRFQSDEGYLAGLIEAFESAKRVKSMLSRKVIFVRQGKVMETKGKLTPEMFKKAIERYSAEPGTEVLNTMPFERAVARAVELHIA